MQVTRVINNGEYQGPTIVLCQLYAIYFIEYGSSGHIPMHFYKHQKHIILGLSKDKTLDMFMIVLS
jgi:hypothetical protein